MAKTLNQFLEGYLKVKNPDEQKFVDKHVVAKHSDRNGNDDEVFKGTKVKPIDRRKDRHGYNPGEDEKVYEELKGNQHKIDANKNGKIDAEDFKHLRKKKKVAEEAEQIDELSTGTLQSYRKKARAQGNAIVDKMKMGGGDWSKDQKDTKTLRKRASGAQMSGKQLVKRGESLKTEEAEQIDELSKKTLRKYERATQYGGTHKNVKGNQIARAKLHGRADGYRARVLASEEAEDLDEAKKKIVLPGRPGWDEYVKNRNAKAKRFRDAMNTKLPDHKDPDAEYEKARHKAANPRMESVEQIDELSKNTLRSYVDKRATQRDLTSHDIVRRNIAAASGVKPRNKPESAASTRSYHRAINKIVKDKDSPDRPKVLATEEAEQIDELSKTTLATYAVKAKNQMGRDEARAGYQRGIRTMDGKGQGEMERAHDRRAEKRSKGIDNALNRLAKEEVQIDEISAETKASYMKKAGGEIDKLYDKSKTDARSAYKYYGRKNTMRKIANEEAELEEKLNMDKASMGDVIKDFRDSNAPQFKGKSKEKRRAMAIAAKLTAERGGKPLRKEEKLADLLGDLTESHRRTMLSVFDKLNESNQKKFLEACETPEGVESMLDFSISHRGE